jgi:hypothetical protein
MPPTNYDPRIKLLQFVHRLYTDKTFQGQFGKDPEGCMSEYALTSDQKSAVYHAGVDPIYLSADGVPIVSTWWAEYALYRQDPAKNPYPERSKYVTVERPVGEHASISGVAAMIAEEIRGNDQFQEAW